MGPNELDEGNLASIAHVNDKPILVPADIEDYAVVPDEIGRPIVAANI